MREKKIIKRTKSLCEGCPLDGGCTKVWGRSDSDKPRIIFLGEAPGREEDVQGEPFVGSAGTWLRNACKRAGLVYHTIHKTNVISCRPPENNISALDAVEAIECCEGGLWQELNQLYDNGARIIVPLGNTALRALGIEENISKARGSIYTMRWKARRLVRVEDPNYEMLVVPTYHPSYIMRGQTKEEPVWINDLIRINEVAAGGYKPPKERFATHPTIEQVEAFAEKVVEAGKPVGVDIEATSLVPEKAEVVMIGFATSASDALCVPFYRQGKRPYWQTASEAKRAHEACRKILAHVPTVFQNALYDVRVLDFNKMPVENLAHDILLMHHALSPELPHGLSYIVSEYGQTPYWKDVVLKSEKLIFQQEDTEFRTYNLRDSVVLLQCLKPLMKDCKKYGSYKAYEKISMPLVPAIKEMMDTGLLLSESRRRKYRHDTYNAVEAASEKIKELCNLPHGFNINSADHMRKLLYDINPASHEKRKQELKLYYVPGTKKQRTTKKYHELEQAVNAIESVEPLQLPRMNISKTASGQAAIDKQQLMNIAIACNNRLNEIAAMKRKTKAHAKEVENLHRVKEFLAIYRDYQDNHKILSTYTTFPVSDDGRVHFPYKIHGTYTGRLASGNKKGGQAGNAQNLPKSARHLFVAPKGSKLIQVDYANLELYILALVSDDDVLIKAFEDYFAGRGDKPHEVNCKMLFGIDKEDERWETYYNLTKRYIFGRNYGGTLRGIYEKLMQELPEMPITFSQFKAIDQRYRDQHPKYTEWYDKTVETIKKQRWLRNPFGRIRYFLGSEYEIVREGLNFPIQSTAADLMNLALIGIKNELDAQRAAGKWKNVRLCATVHDSVIMEGPQKLVKPVTKMVLDVMEKPVDIEGKKASFKAEAEVGDDWKNLKPFGA